MNRMKTRKFLYVLFVLLLMASFIPAVVNAEPDVIAGGEWDGGPVTWKITADGTLTISGNQNIQEKPQYTWMDYSDVVTRIVVEDGITSIPQGAFYGMANVKSVYLSNTLEKIGRSAFEDCDQLEAIALPARLNILEMYAFYSCDNLKTISFAEGSRLRNIDEYVFSRSGVTQLISPSGLKNIEAHAFEYCTSLETVILKEGVENIDAKAFLGCGNLKYLCLGECISSIGSRAFDQCNAIEHVELYTRCVVSFPERTSLKTAIIGGKARSIANDCFENCTSLEKVIIGPSVENIGCCAFAVCKSLKTVVLPENLKTIGDCAFNSSGITGIVVPDSVTELGSASFGYCDDLVTVKIGAGVSSLQNMTFTNCPKLTTVDLGNVKIIGRDAFLNCTSLENVRWSDHLEEIYDNAFENCTSLETVTLAPTVFRIENYGFINCTSLKKITFQGNAPEMGYVDNIFENVTATAYYPADKNGWTEEMMRDYNGNITWVPVCQQHTEQLTSATEATCSTSGWTEGSYCGVCGVVLRAQQVVPALEHKYEQTKVVVACKKIGCNVLVCSGCGYSYPELTDVESRHRFGQWQQKFAADYGVAGEQRRYCEDCDAFESRMIAALTGTEPKPTQPNPTQPTETKPDASESTVPDPSEPEQTEPTEPDVTIEPTETTSPEPTTPEETTDPDPTAPAESTPESTSPTTQQQKEKRGNDVVLTALLIAVLGGAGAVIVLVLKKRYSQ